MLGIDAWGLQIVPLCQEIRSCMSAVFWRGRVLVRCSTFVRPAAQEAKQSRRSRRRRRRSSSAKRTLQIRAGPQIALHRSRSSAPSALLHKIGKGRAPSRFKNTPVSLSLSFCTKKDTATEKIRP